MSKNTFYVVAIIGGLIIVVLLVVLWMSGPTNTELGETAISVQSTGNAFVPVKDFISANPTYDESTVLHADSSYAIQFDKDTQTFQITFTVATTDEANAVRRSAEEVLLRQLGVSNTDACTLRVTEVFAKAQELGLPTQTFGLSFCQDAESFHQ